MQHLLNINDLRVLRQAATQGLLEREDPRELMELLLELNNGNQDLRAVALTFARNHANPEEAKADWRNPRRWRQWCLWELLSDEDAEKLLHTMLYGKMTREVCMRTMFRMHQYLTRGVFAPDINLNHPAYPTMQADAMVDFACCAESGQMMELLMAHLPEKLQNVVRANWEERFFFRGSPLVLAAAMGRTEQVKLLLDSGVHPDEEGLGDVSCFFTRQFDFIETGFHVTPVLSAILFGQEETAKLLLERGAYCDFRCPEHRAVLIKGSAESLRLAETLSDVGFEMIPTQELEALRIMTSGQGERALFWNSLRQRSVCQTMQ
jgi:ankyrin repeat protein